MSTNAPKPPPPKPTTINEGFNIRGGVSKPPEGIRKPPPPPPPPPKKK